MAGTGPPPLSLSMPTWEEHYDNTGSKYWVHTMTRQATNIDPYV